MSDTQQRLLGFPANAAPQVDDELAAPLLNMLLNNIGDPRTPDPYGMGSKDFEQEVVELLAWLAGAHPDDTYGYLAPSSSYGIGHGLKLGRDRLPHAPVYYSSAAHYAVPRQIDLLRMDAVQVPALPDGRMDTIALERACKARPGRGAVVLATIGTTMTGAIDPLPEIRRAASPAGPMHLHADGALGGLVAALAPPSERHPWAFDGGADSVTVSGHKFLGCPIPCAILLARKELVRPAQQGQYVGRHQDGTLACSRSGLAALLLWRTLARLGLGGMEKQVLSCLEVADYAQQRLTELGLHAWRHPGSITVVLDPPPPEVRARFSIPVEDGIAHIIAVPHVTPDLVDEFCDAQQTAKAQGSPLS
ncbi:pyridoxal-dependent decarboxylase [Mangrovactinospora gilvigrisea]|uniref:pyridoxal-dependent decarboxylase n=1 Tax=Mangrovactinospora gilvigrisea TaxID=1428644 RepID=UPI0009A0AA60|nr:pyridoxal-dependent decarboxylase [Mangrovactinospora gilvigrisea]